MLKKNSVKNIRMEKESLQTLLFKQFEKHQFYNIKDLKDITRQPVVRIISHILYEMLDNIKLILKSVYFIFICLTTSIYNVLDCYIQLKAKIFVVKPQFV